MYDRNFILANLQDCATGRWFALFGLVLASYFGSFSQSIAQGTQNSYMDVPEGQLFFWGNPATVTPQGLALPMEMGFDIGAFTEENQSGPAYLLTQDQYLQQIMNGHTGTDDAEFNEGLDWDNLNIYGETQNSQAPMVIPTMPEDLWIDYANTHGGSQYANPPDYWESGTNVLGELHESRRLLWNISASLEILTRSLWILIGAFLAFCTFRYVKIGG